MAAAGFMAMTLCFMTTTRLAAAILFSLALGAPLGAVAADVPYDLVSGDG